MMDKIVSVIAEAVSDLYELSIMPVVTRTDETHGDFATNIAMQLAPRIGKKPRDIAEEIIRHIGSEVEIKTAEIAGPGFINICINDAVIFNAIDQASHLEKALQGKVIVTEYSDPNPFKVLHAGHLYTTIVGDAISNIIETAGATVYRTNFGGDVGLHVGKAMWGIIKKLGGENVEGLDKIPESERPQWISERYVEGNTAYENDETSKQQITEVNKRVYKLHQDEDTASPLARIYWACRQWSYDGFEKLYADLEVKPFDKYYPESVTTPAGLQLVQTALNNGVLEKSDGAVVYKGEKDGLHTRVFLNSDGLPTYEAKDLGLIEFKWREYHFDKSVIITGNDIIEYMKVVLKVMSSFQADIEDRTVHLTHGMVKLPGNKKMSSRAGTVFLADDILKAAYDASENKDAQVVLGAVRYSFLKNRVGGDIVYDPEESVSMDGNSGPYLQYALVRARSIVRKAGELKAATSVQELDVVERSLAFKITEFQEVFNKSLEDYSPHHIANYLYELAVVFNRFYENSRVIDDPRSDVRIALVVSYEKVLSGGLSILGMPKPESM